jgi:EAL domain-containing protein (putative c-di-GMP-specific phosphodiesterase class I)
MLTRYPVSRLKIDQRFTKSVCESAPDAAIIQAVLGLASALHLHVTAEGIETPAQAQALICSGCEEGQGYYYGAPMPAEEFTRRFVPLTVRSEAPVRAL